MSNNIVKALVVIRGTRPLMLNWFGPNAIPLDKRKEKTGVGGNDPEEWRKSTTVTKDGQLFMPGNYAFATIREGSKYTKKGRGSIQSNVVACLQILDDRILVDDRFMPGFPNGQDYDITKEPAPPRNPELPVFMDVRMTKNPGTSRANVRYRVCASSGWTCSFSIMWDKSIVSKGEMEASIIDAGKLSGIANGRKIGMGRFELEKFEIQE